MTLDRRLQFDLDARELLNRHETERIEIAVRHETEWADLCRKHGDEAGAVIHERAAAQFRKIGKTP